MKWLADISLLSLSYPNTPEAELYTLWVKQFIIDQQTVDMA